jgi:carbonic anhydrase
MDQQRTHALQQKRRRTALEQQAMVTTLENLMTFPCVRTLVERGKLQLHAAYFAVGTGLLSVRDPQTGVFEALAGAQT